MLDAILGFVLGFVTTYFIARFLINRFLDKITEELEESTPEENIIVAKVEQHEDTFYIYNATTEEFLVQGHDMAELIEHLEKRKPGTIIKVVGGEKSAIANLKATIQ